MRPAIDIYLIVDRSSSTKTIIAYINNAIKAVVEKLCNMPELNGVDKYLSLIQYNHKADVVLDTVKLETVDLDSIKLVSEGATDTGAALLKAFELDLKNMRERMEDGTEMWRPLFFLFTDGYPDAGKNASESSIAAVEKKYREAGDKIKEGEKTRSLVFIAAGFFNEDSDCIIKANLNKLRELTDNESNVVEVSGGSAEDFAETFCELIPTGVINSITNGDSAIDFAFFKEKNRK